jgi:molybdopterin/thiamine biosynthesis adenylyltransferase
MLGNMNDEWLERYSRQILLTEIDFSGQEAIASASVAIIGCGGLGSMIGLYLAGAGIGAITLIDDDVVELSNLHRQLAFRETDLGKPKSEALARQLCALNKDVTITAERYRFGTDSDRDEASLKGIDLVLDATDNLEARHHIEAITRALGLPWVMGAATRLHGQVAAFSRSRREGCYQCIAPVADAQRTADCRNEGVLGPVIGIIAAWQAQDALLSLAAKEPPAWGVLRIYDAKEQRIDKLAIGPVDGCAHF